MATATLVRRKAQLDLLGEACAARGDATVTLSLPGEEPAVLSARMRSWGGGEVCVELTSRVETSGVGVLSKLGPRMRATVSFAAREGRFWFRTPVIEVTPTVAAISSPRTTNAVSATSVIDASAEPGGAKDETQFTLRLARPLCIEAERRRSAQRIRLTSAPPTYGTFVPIEDAQLRFVARLSDYSGGGLGTNTRNLGLLARRRGELFWTHISLPGETHECDFVVRLTHVRHDLGEGAAVSGWAFHPGDDCGHFDENFARLERFVKRYCREEPGGAPRGAAHEEGEKPWK